jgi:hypothetical protein
MTHHWIIARTHDQREQHLHELALPPLLARIDAHRRLRGPYTAAGSLVRVLAADRKPSELARHDTEVLTVAPELVGAVPNERHTLTSLAPPEERTRYYPPSRTRRIAHGIVELVQEVLSPDGPRSLVVENVDEADPTDTEWLEIMLRRMRAEQLHIVITTRGEVADQALAWALNRYATRVEGGPADDARSLRRPVTARAGGDP